jgi:4-amino-4-deoxy-L-arabinose transferase-like glycosyltransferase
VHRQVQPALSGQAPGPGDGGAGRPPSDRALHATLALLLVVWAGALLHDLGSRPVSSTAEQRCFDVMRGMLESGDWVVPRRDGVVRLHKPPLAYWTSAAAARLTGEDDLFALRLPSVLASVGRVLLTYAWGRAAGGARAGLAAAAALMFMQSFFALGRRGVAEMQLALYCQLALYAFLRLHAGGGRAWLAVFAAGLAGGVLAKATVALLVVGLPIAAFLGWQGSWRRVLRPSVALWVALGVGLGGAWYGVVLVRVPDAWDTLHAQLVLPLGADVDEDVATALHARPVWTYVRLLLVAAAPAVLAAPWALRRAVASRVWCTEPGLRLAALTFGSLFVAFSLIPGKQKHYLLPLLPSLALLLGASGVHLAHALPGWFARRVRVAGLAAAAVGLGLAVLFGRALGRQDSLAGADLALYGGCAAALLLATALAAWHRRALALLVLLLVLDLGAQILYSRTYDVWRQDADAGSVPTPDGAGER